MTPYYPAIGYNAVVIDNKLKLYISTAVRIQYKGRWRVVICKLARDITPESVKFIAPDMLLNVLSVMMYQVTEEIQKYAYEILISWQAEFERLDQLAQSKDLSAILGTESAGGLELYPYDNIQITERQRMALIRQGDTSPDLRFYNFRSDVIEQVPTIVDMLHFVSTIEAIISSHDF